MRISVYGFAMCVMAGLVTPQLALADCADTGNTGSGGDIIVCTGADADGYNGTANGDDVTVQPGATVEDDGDDSIFTAAGADAVTVNGGTVTADIDDAISTGDDEDTVTVHAGTLDAEEDAIDGDPGNDDITVDGGTLHGDENCIDGGGGVDTITVNGGTLSAGDSCINNGDDDGEITITGGTLTSVEEVVKGNDGENLVTITGGTLTSSDEDVIDTDGGDDTVSIRNATLTTQDEPDHVAVQLDTGDDQLTLGNGAVIQGNEDGLIDGGDHEKGDTLIFDMTVPAGELAALQAAIAAANPAGDSITINGETYTWINFEELVDSLSGQVVSESTRATFEVTKNFTDGNPNEVEVKISCFTGLPLNQSADIDESQGVEFVVVDFDNGELDCTVSETPLAGYSTSYYTEGGSYDDEGCHFTAVESGDELSCAIENEPDLVDVEICKEWVYSNSSGDEIDDSYSVVLTCPVPIDGGYRCGDGLFCADWDSSGDGCHTFQVEVEYGGDTCSASENVYDSAVEPDDGDCQNLSIDIAQGAECTIVNTVFYEGIPTMSQYGLALLALAMLGIGIVGFRRFA